LGIARDASGNVYITGFTNSSDFPTAGAIQSKYAGKGGQPPGQTGDAFVTAFNSTGSIIFSTYLGGTQDDMGVGVTVDSGGSIYVTGNTMSLDFPTAKGVLQTGFAGASGSPFCFPQAISSSRSSERLLRHHLRRRPHRRSA
jgi:hypothetical protein